MNTLVYDGRLEEVSTPMPGPICWYPDVRTHLLVPRCPDPSVGTSMPGPIGQASTTHSTHLLHPLVQVQSSVLLMSGYAVGKRFYKASNVIDGLDHLTAVPCGVCPVVSRVRERER